MPLGKPILDVTIEDIRRLIAEEEPEGRHLEFKSDIPSSKEEQKEWQKAGRGTKTVNSSWRGRRHLADFGRDALLEELVAFANGDGGVVILGMSETTSAPARAAELEPLPEVQLLERKLRDAIVDCVEPRLPYTSVRAISMQHDGSGIVLLETSPSIFGPHWVRTSRRATIRREDRCDRLSMPEIHEMVLRNDRRLGSIDAQFISRRAEFAEFVRKALLRRVPHNAVIGSDPDVRARVWLNTQKLAALAVRVTAISHVSLGIPRIENFGAFVPSSNGLAIRVHNELTPIRAADQYWPSAESPRLVLGGAVVEDDYSQDLASRFSVLRDGVVEYCLLRVEKSDELFLFLELLIAQAVSVLATFHRLRVSAGFSALPFQVEVEITTYGEIRVLGGNRFAGSEPLEARLAFPRYTVGELESIAPTVHEMISDVANAGGLSAAHIPEIVWEDLSRPGRVGR